MTIEIDFNSDEALYIQLRNRVRRGQERCAINNVIRVSV